MLTLKNIHIKGFRSIVDLNVPLQNLSVFIGKNNAGKSNILLATKLLLEASSRDVAIEDFYKGDAGEKNLIELYGEFSISQDYMTLCDEKHRAKIQACIINQMLKIRRLISKDVTGRIKVGSIELWQEDKKEYSTVTGIDAAFKQFLPEVIFIEAFKDPSEESKTKGTAALGKILKQIVEQVSDKISDDVTAAIAEAEKKFNRIIRDGKELDDRPDELRRVEGRIKSHIQNVFTGSDVRLKFNLPNVTDLISTATVELKDRGPWTAPDGKGQGFQRVLYVALLQTLADELRDETAAVNRPFILLYEEPEAFLHPALQREVGNIIESISTTNQVVVASHSPLLVNPSRLENIIILRQELAPHPHQTKLSIPDSSLFDCDEDRNMISLLKLNNTSEFLFSDFILVVEGVSDKLLIESSWNRIRDKYDKKFETISVIESGGKDIVPVWICYLSKMGFPVKGCVDLDFLWNGAGKILEDEVVGKFCERFWAIAETSGYLESDKEGKTKHCLKNGCKKDAIELIVGTECDNDLNQWAKYLFTKLREKNIWVLTQGEIECYFGLNHTSKTQYVSVSQNIRKGRTAVPTEIEELLIWLFE